ncbi:TonB-dependent receptor [Altererythrobacter sp. CC-YST694]|uniref:TonB-dependent receptor n=1 Tax=Altererythrobacter sp. CC-YST694 TaxID=2755038 RepID=UPI001D027145|nr:TonB-dependent receptor [Altererythrobacter sp. CC-YST694]MCB5426493.1 TonB-dependent receptor [Altererythrobacter sp. CC-YST694]
MPYGLSPRAFRAGAANLAIAVSLFTGGTAFAQDEGSSQQGGVHEIVVTAQFKSQNIQETPLAITAVDSTLMEARSQTNVQDVAQRAPSVSFTAGGQGGGAQTAAANIRGIGQSDFQFPNEPGVGIYIDDVYYGISFASAFDLVDLDRVEILRGPQGTLSGKNSIGGSIKLFSRKPNDDPDAYVEATVGSFGRLGLKAATNATIVPDKLYLRLTGVGKYVDGYLKRLDYECVTGKAAPGGVQASPAEDCVVGTEGGQNVLAARGALRWIVNDRIENNFIADVTRDRSEASPGKAIFLPPINGNDYVTGPEEYTNYATYTGYPGLADQYTNPAISYVNSWGFSNNLEIGLSDNVTLTSITAFRHADGKSSWDGDNSPENVSNNTTIFDHDQFTQELRLSATLGEMFDMTVGGYYYKGDSRIGGRVNVGAAGLDFVSNDPFKQTSKSAFIHGVMHITDQLNLTAGVRYTDENKTYTFSRSNPNPSLPTDPRVASLDGLTKSFSGDNIDWRVALDYEVLPDIRFYGQVATGFKGGGINPRPYLEAQAVPYAQEKATSYEAGLKTMLFDRRLRLNMAYYHTDYNDYQGLVSSCPDLSPPGFTFCSATRNVGDAKIDGFEVEFDAQPVEGLSIDGSVSYTKFDFVTGIDGSSIVPGVTKAPFVPEWKYAIGGQYELQLAGLGSLTPRVDWTWQSEMESNIPNGIPGFLLGRVESRGLLNARVTFKTEDKDWEVALAATNLTDKFYYANKYDRVSQSGNAYGLPGRPREIMFSIKRNF